MTKATLDKNGSKTISSRRQRFLVAKVSRGGVACLKGEVPRTAMKISGDWRAAGRATGVKRRNINDWHQRRWRHPWYRHRSGGINSINGYVAANRATKVAWRLIVYIEA